MHCSKCSFIAKSKGGLTTHMKSHMEDDYKQLRQVHENSMTLYNILQSYPKNVQESTVILGLAIKLQEAETKIQGFQEEKVPLIENDMDREFTENDFKLLLEFKEIRSSSLESVGPGNLPTYVWTSSKFNKFNNLLTDFSGDKYLFPEAISWSIGGQKWKFPGSGYFAGIPEVSQITEMDRSDDTFKIMFNFYSKASLLKKFPGIDQFLDKFRVSYISNIKVFGPFMRDLVLYTYEDFKLLISLCYGGRLFVS